MLIMIMKIMKLIKIGRIGKNSFIQFYLHIQYTFYVFMFVAKTFFYSTILLINQHFLVF